MHGEISMKLHTKFTSVANLDNMTGERTSVLIHSNPLK